MATELTTIQRKDVADTIKVFDTITRKAIDEALALGNDFARAHNDEAKRVNVARAIAVYRIASDKEAVEKTGFKTFKDVAAALFGLAPANATNYRKAAEQFYCNDNAPICKDWWGPSTLYLFCAAGVDNDTIKTAIEAGKLKKDTTNDGIKAWIASLEADALEDGKADVVKLYDAEVTCCDYDCNGVGQVSIKAFHGVTMDEIKTAMLRNGLPNTDDFFTAFNPHAELTRPTKKGTKTIMGKGLFYACTERMSKAVYFSAETSKAKAKGPTAETVSAQQKTIEALMARIAQLERKTGGMEDEGDAWDAGNPIPGTAGDPFTP